MNFKKKYVFSVNPAPGVSGPRYHPSTLIDFINTALARKSSVKPISMILEGYRTHGDVTGPMKFKKKEVFFRKIVLPGFWGPWLQSVHLN